MKKILPIVIVIIGLSSFLHAQDRLAKKWVNKQYASLSLKEKIAQLMIIRAHSNWDQHKIDSISDLIQTYNVGGLCFFQGGPIREALQTNYYQSIAKTPLLITMDAEWGVGMRLDSVETFPRQLSLGAMPSNTLVYQMGAAIAAQCKRLGIQVNYAPVVDINNNPLNPVINDRSFGQDKKTVMDYGIAYMKGLQDNGIMATAKHFPGHGDVSVDSHLELPIIHKSATALDSMELIPFKALIDAGIASVMVAHLSVPTIDEEMPTSLSPNAVNNLLKKQLGFKGISITDALDMKAISSNYPEGEANVQAIIAGNDMLCLPGDIEQSIKSVQLAIKNGRLKKRDINTRVKKILLAKYTYGLSEFKKIDTNNIVENLNTSVAVIKEAIAKQALTYLKPSSYIPINTNKKIAYVALGTTQANVLTEAFLNYKNAAVFYIDGKDSAAIIQLKSNLNGYDQVIIGLHNYNRRPVNHFEIPSTILTFLNESGHENWIHLIMGNPYAIANFPNINNILIAYEDNKYSQKAVLDWLEGKSTATGILPVSINETLQAGLSSTKYNSSNETVDSKKKDELGISINKLAAIDSIVADAIQKKAIPGCQVLVAKNNQIVFNKSYGHIAGEGSALVSNETVYDLASLTKTSATTVAIMKLSEEGKIDIHKTIGDYLPWVKDSPKAKITLKNLLLHEAGLYPYIKFYESLLDQHGALNINLVSPIETISHQKIISPRTFLINSWEDSIYAKILNSPVTKTGNYIYSDNDFILLGMIVEKVSGMSLNEYVTQQFYNPLKMSSTDFLPLRKTNLEHIAATEIDTYFRHELIHGTVHDEGAAVMGGIAGHAGLFSNATDLAKLYLMLLNKGNWDGKTYLHPATIAQYTANNSTNSRRGLGFDKPEKDNAHSNDPYPCKSATAGTFGHTGFTGTCVWADPENQLLYIFLSNRVYPTRDNKTFSTLNLRPKIQEVIYNALQPL